MECWCWKEFPTFLMFPLPVWVPKLVHVLPPPVCMGSQLWSVDIYTTQATFPWKEWPDCSPPHTHRRHIQCFASPQVADRSYFRYLRAESSRLLWWLLRSPFKRKKISLPSMWTVSAQWRLLALCKIGHLWWPILSCYLVTYLITLFSFWTLHWVWPTNLWGVLRCPRWA